MLAAMRSLRKVEGLDMHRLRVDIKDFSPRGLSQLQPEHTPWVAYGKHLCGAATDLTLRCCAEAAFPRTAQSAAAASAAVHAGTGRSATCQNGDDGRQAQMPGGRQQNAVGKFRGLAVATCCHHGCAWEHYVGQQLFANLGFSPEEFEIISWMTGRGEQELAVLTAETFFLPKSQPSSSGLWAAESASSSHWSSHWLSQHCFALQAGRSVVTRRRLAR